MLENPSQKTPAPESPHGYADVPLLFDTAFLTSYGFSEGSVGKQAVAWSLKFLQAERWGTVNAAIEKNLDVDDNPELEPAATALYNATINNEEEYERYVAILTALIGRFGKEAFQSAAEQMCTENFSRLDPRYFKHAVALLRKRETLHPELTESAQQYIDLQLLAQHSDTGRLYQKIGELFTQITGTSPRVESQTMDGTWKVINITPLFGDIWFWQALHAIDPTLENNVASWLSDFVSTHAQGVAADKFHPDIRIFPREVLKFMFPLAYEYLTVQFPNMAFQSEQQFIESAMKKDS